MNDERETRATTLSETTETAFAMALLWAIPVLAFLLTLARL